MQEVTTIDITGFAVDLHDFLYFPKRLVFVNNAVIA